MPFTHVLVPTDFSDLANEALRYAIEEATLHRARLTILHVLPPHRETDVYYVSGAPPVSGYTAGLDPDAGGGHLGGGPSSPPTVVRDDPDQDALARLRDLVGETFAGDWQGAVVAGHPADAIVHEARERGVDLIVMSTHGRTGLRHVLLGSVAETVVRSASCPVLTIRSSGHRS